MNSKKTVVLGGVGLLIAIVLLITIVLLAQLSNGADTTNNTTNPTSNPISDPNVNIIDLNNTTGGGFSTAVIKADDTIELRNSLNEKFIIGLEKKHWKSLKWSPDGKLIAVLGKTTSSIFDIYIYNLSQKSWSQATDYKNFNTGVEQYTWADNNNILFVQGETPNRWLHKFNYISKETLKVSNVVGNITYVSQDLKHLVINAESTVPIIYNNQGEQISILDSLKDAETQDQLAFNKVEFFANSEKILALDVNGNYYKFNLGDTTAVKTTLTSDYNIVCSLTENSFNAYLITSNSISYGSYSSKDDLFNILGEEAFKLAFTIDENLSYCANGSVYLKLNFADGSTQWYKEDATKLEADAILDGNTETDIIRK